MDESVHRRAGRMLVVGAADDMSPAALLSPDGLLIVLESDVGRAAEMRRAFAADGLSARATVIGGDPRRMLYKLAGPFDLIVCGQAHLALRPMLEKLLAPEGALVTDVAR